MQTVAKTPRKIRGCHSGQLPLSPVRTRYTASLASPAIFGTRWNASLPGLGQWQSLLARTTWPAPPATRAVSQNKQAKKGNNV